MVVGNGLVAKSFKQYESAADFLIFASGVSNSKTSTFADYKREQDLLTHTLNAYPTKRFVYFSTCSIDDPDLQDTAYIRHKLNMEGFIAANAAQYNIFRLSNLAGFSKNPHTVLNFFYYHIMANQPFELWKYSERNIIDVEDVFHLSDHILKNNLFPNTVINIANTSNYTVRYIIECIEVFCKKKAIFTEMEKGKKFEINVSDIVPICKLLGITFKKDYLPSLLEKYYSGNEL